MVALNLACFVYQSCIIIPIMLYLLAMLGNRQYFRCYARRGRETLLGNCNQGFARLV